MTRQAENILYHIQFYNTFKGSFLGSFFITGLDPFKGPFRVFPDRLNGPFLLRAFIPDWI